MRVKYLVRFALYNWTHKVQKKLLTGLIQYIFSTEINSNEQRCLTYFFKSLFISFHYDEFYVNSTSLEKTHHSETVGIGLLIFILHQDKNKETSKTIWLWRSFYYSLLLTRSSTSPTFSSSPQSTQVISGTNPLPRRSGQL